MAAERLSMRKIKEVLRLHAAGVSARAISESLRISHSTVNDYVRRIKAAQLSWPLPACWADADLEAQLWGASTAAPRSRPLPDWQGIHEELQRKQRTGVTLQLLWLEYKQAHPEGLQYSQFCQRYADWRGRLDRVMRQQHRAGEKAFVDFAGQTVPVIDRSSGAVHEAEVFVGVLGASNYTYAEGCESQQLSVWIGCHVHMYDYFGGVPTYTIPDNTRTAVRHACFYDPDINPTYQDMAAHYNTAIVPARVRKPRDKSKVEVGVQVVERWILARLRHQTFFTMSALNDQIARLLEQLNERPFQKLDGCRRSRFERIDRPALQPLPAQPYEMALWQRARVNIDYHVEVCGHYYSVPHRLVRERVDVCIRRHTVEILHGGRRVAAHVRQLQRGGFSTDPAHRPPAHAQYVAWPPSRLITWAQQNGPQTGAMARQIIDSKTHPEQGYRACLGLMRLAGRYSPARLEAACARALHMGACAYRSVQSILDNGLDQVPLHEPTPIDLPQQHDHLRGQDYYASDLKEQQPC